MLPQGCIVYRAYLSPSPPAEYPNLGPQLNARWADFSDWIAWIREQTVYRYAQGIRQVDPDRPIVFMSPTDYAAGVKHACQDFGGVFHDTGAMAGFWNDYNTLVMNGDSIARRLRAGQRRRRSARFQAVHGPLDHGGNEGVDYFIHIGDILWKPDVKKYFSESQPLWHLIGKYHPPDARIGLLNSDRVLRLIGFPWGYDPNTVLRGGQWQWRLADLLQPRYPRHLLDESDFSAASPPRSGNAEQIPRHYRRKYDDHGRTIARGHRAPRSATAAFSSPTSKPAGTPPRKKTPGQFPSSRAIPSPRSTRTTPRGRFITRGNCIPPPGRSIFVGDWSAVRGGNGLSLRKSGRLPGFDSLGRRQRGGRDATDRQRDDHSSGRQIRSRSRRRQRRARSPRVGRDPALAGIRRSNATGRPGVLMNHFVSNNGLYDVWTMWNENPKDATAELKFRDGLNPASGTEIGSDSLVRIEQHEGDSKISSLKFTAWQTRVFLTPPRRTVASSAAMVHTTAQLVARHGRRRTARGSRSSRNRSI